MPQYTSSEKQTVKSKMLSAVIWVSLLFSHNHSFLYYKSFLFLSSLWAEASTVYPSVLIGLHLLRPHSQSSLLTS